MMEPAGITASKSTVRAPSWRFALTSAWIAALSVSPTIDGTETRSLPLTTSTLTVDPWLTMVPAGGSCPTIVPSAVLFCLT